MTFSVLSVSFLPVHSLMLASVVAIFILFTHVIMGSVFIYKKNSVWPFALLLLLFVYSCLANVWASVSDVAFSKNILAILLNCIPSTVLLAFFIKKYLKIKNDESTIVSLMAMVHIVILIVALSVIIGCINQDMRRIFESVFPPQGNILDSNHHQYGFRIRGILPATGASGSIFLAFGAVFSVFLAYLTSSVRSWFYLGSLILFIPAIILNGRTGLVFLVLVAVIFFVLSVATQIIALQNRYSLNRFLSNVIIIIILICLTTCLSINISSILPEHAIARTFQPINNVMQGQWDETIFYALWQMIIIPESIFELFFGNISKYSVSRIASDIGYIRVLNAVGIVGTLLYYSFWIILSLKIIANTKNPKMKKMLASFLVSIFIIEIKESFWSYLFVSVLIISFYVVTVVKPRFRRGVGNLECSDV